MYFHQEEYILYAVDLKQKNLVLWAIFLSALGAVLIAMSTIVFPNLIMKTFGSMPDFFGINPFEPGIMAFPFLITNFILLGITILYFKGRLPKKISSSFRFITNFEISRRAAILIMILLIGGFITFTVNQLFTEESFVDYHNVDIPILKKFDIHKIPSTFNLFLKYILVTNSMKLFGSYRVIPYLASISLLVLTYFFTKLVTKSRFAGIVSMTVLLQSSIFLIYNSSVAYTNFWILFYLLSLYVVYKAWSLSAVSYIASILTKPESAVLLPFTLFFIYRSDIPKRKKILACVPFIFVIIVSIYAAIRWKVTTSIGSIDANGFWSAYNAFAYQLRFDPIIVIFLLPVTVVLFMRARKGVMHADSLLFLIIGTVLLQPLSAAFTVVSSEPYRFMPLVTFFAISVGMLLSKNVHGKGTSTSQ